MLLCTSVFAGNYSQQTRKPLNNKQYTILKDIILYSRNIYCIVDRSHYTWLDVSPVTHILWFLLSPDYFSIVILLLFSFDQVKWERTDLKFKKYTFKKHKSKQVIIWGQNSNYYKIIYLYQLEHFLSYITMFTGLPVQRE